MNKLTVGAGVALLLGITGALGPSPRHFLTAALMFLGLALIVAIIRFFWRPPWPEDPDEAEDERLKMLVPAYRAEKEKRERADRFQDIRELAVSVLAAPVIAAALFFAGSAVVLISADVVGGLKNWYGTYQPIQQVGYSVDRKSDKFNLPLTVNASVFKGEGVAVSLNLDCAASGLEKSCNNRVIYARIGDCHWRPVGRRFRAWQQGLLFVTIQGLWWGGCDPGLELGAQRVYGNATVQVQQ